MTAFCPHVEGSFVQRAGFNGIVRKGQVVKRTPWPDGWILSVRLADGVIEPWPCDGTTQAAAPDGALMLGMRGKPVSALQRRLEKAGFPPGKIDGDFDVATRSAVESFQRSQAFAPTGIVDRVTLRELGGKPAAPADVWPRFTVAIVARMFSSSTPLGAIKANLPLVAAQMRASGLVSRHMALMALATIRAETESFEPISERVSRWNTSPDGHPFDLYDARTRDLGNQGKPDGEKFKGRGFVQLTGRANYMRMSQLLNVDLVGKPELANQPDLAARILASFISEREQRIEQALLHDDLASARRLVNGGSHGLDRFTAAYRTGEVLVP